MSLLPETITVKRKRSRDGALDFLRFEDAVSKRHKGHTGGNDTWVYERRKVVDLESAESVDEQTVPFRRIPAPVEEPSCPRRLAGLPVIRTSKPGDEKRHIKPLPLRQKKNLAPADLPAPPAPALLGQDIRNARRFHLSRNISENAWSGPSGVIGSRVTKKRAAVFVEGGGPTKPTKRQALRNAVGHQTEDVDERHEAKMVVPENDVDMDSMGACPTARKRPGARSRISSSREKKLPPSLLDRRVIDMDQLTEEMDLFMLDEVSKNLALIEEAKTKERARAERARFRPKGQAPGQRIFERDPDRARLEKTMKDADGEGGKDGDVDMYGWDEDDYVSDVYVRVPASRLTDTVPPQQIGVLVFDNETDRLDFFYGDENDSDDELPEDEDDENAENHYSADYPDEDLEWGDETGANPYSYTTQNASDEEEFDRAWDEDGEST